MRQLRAEQLSRNDYGMNTESQRKINRKMFTSLELNHPSYQQQSINLANKKLGRNNPDQRSTPLLPEINNKKHLSIRDASMMSNNVLGNFNGTEQEYLTSLINLREKKFKQHSLKIVEISKTNNLLQKEQEALKAQLKTMEEETEKINDEIMQHKKMRKKSRHDKKEVKRLSKNLVDVAVEVKKVAQNSLRNGSSIDN